VIVALQALAAMGAWAQMRYCAENAQDTCSPTTAGAGVQPGPSKMVKGFWPTRTIAIVFSQKILSSGGQNFVKAAEQQAAEISRATGYNFYRCEESKIGNKMPYIYFDDFTAKKGVECSSDIGYQVLNDEGLKEYGDDYLKWRQRQPVSIGRCNGGKIILHELLHRLGVQHEHVRDESANYLTPIEDKIPNRASFVRNQGNVDDLKFDGTFDNEYDISSIMHYPLYYFTTKPAFDKLLKDAKAKYVLFDKNTDIGLKTCLSRGDASFLRFLANKYVKGLSCDKYGVSKPENGCRMIPPTLVAPAE
jgi:hypothetical protein